MGGARGSQFSVLGSQFSVAEEAWKLALQQSDGSDRSVRSVRLGRSGRVLLITDHKSPITGERSAAGTWLREQGLEVLAAAAAQFEALPVHEHECAVPSEERVDLPDTIDVDDRRSVNANEPRVELALDLLHRLAEKMCVGARVQRHVIVGSLDPIDLIRVDDDGLVAYGHEKPRAGRGIGL